MNPLKIVCSVFLLSLIFASCKRDRLVDSSVKGRPVWVYGIEPNAIIVEASGRSHDEAREKAFTAVKESIVNSVAVNVNSTVQLEVSEKVMNNVRQFRENTQVNTTVSSAFLSSLRGVHINKASDWYWEQRRTPEKVRYVVYHIKYPFSQEELSAYIAEWEALDQELNSELQKLNSRAEQTQNISELEVLCTEAERLTEIFKEPRRSLAANTATRIRQKMADTRLEVIEHQRGEILVALRSNGDRMRLAEPLRFQSPCASIIDQRFIEEEAFYLVHYDAAFCDKPDQKIVLSASIDGRELSANIAIPEDPNHVRLSIAGPLRLQRLQGSLHEWQLPLRILSDEAVDIVEVEISLERNSGRLLASLSRRGRAGIYTHIRQPLDAQFQGRGDHALRFTAPRHTNEADDIFTSLFENSASYIASGRINYRRNGSEELRSYRFEHLNVLLR